MSDNEASPIPCEDKDGNRYTVYQSPDWVRGTPPPDDYLGPVWFLIRDGEKVRVDSTKHRETGKSYFICEDLENLKLYPIDTFSRDEMT